MIRRAALAAGAVLRPARLVRRRRPPRRPTPARRAADGAGEAALGPALDALGGEVVRLRSRDGLRLAGRWLPRGAPRRRRRGRPTRTRRSSCSTAGPDRVAPDLVEYGPSLRRTAGVLGLDFRGHGGSDDAPTTFGLREIEDVAGALAWLGERGIARVALVGSSMGGITAIAAVAVLGDGRLPGADMDPAAPAARRPAARPRIVAVVARLGRARAGRRRSRRGCPARAARLARRRGCSTAPRGRSATIRGRPSRPASSASLEGVPLLLIHGDGRHAPCRSPTRRRLAAAAPARRSSTGSSRARSTARPTRPTPAATSDASRTSCVRPSPARREAGDL